MTRPSLISTRIGSCPCSYYQSVSTEFELIRSSWRATAIESISRILFCVTVSNTFCGGSGMVNVRQCCRLAPFVLVFRGLYLIIYSMYLSNTRILNTPVGPSHCLVYIILDFSKAWLIQSCCSYPYADLQFLLEDLASKFTLF